MKKIDNADLRPSDVPSDKAEWNEIVLFAHTFDGYQFHGSFEKCAEIANARKNETLTDLRTCLFFEQRRCNHVGCAPDVETMKYIRSLLAQIRAHVAKFNP